MLNSTLSSGLNPRLNARDIAALGFMTFAMYLGAGNLIFPPFLAFRPVNIFWVA